jgi:hypothetical protein
LATMIPRPTPPDFFLWGFLKGRVCSHNSRSLEGLARNTEQASAGTDKQSLESCKQHCAISECLSSKRWGTLSASAVITHCVRRGLHNRNYKTDGICWQHGRSTNANC